MIPRAAYFLLAAMPLLAEEKPISADPGPLGEQLRKWASEGTAAGNAGDAYDNRDGGHSGLDVKPYPQLEAHTYSDEEKKTRRDWGLQREVLPRVVFGNSSTSASPETGGSNPRQAYSSPGGLELLARQYRANNLYIYPEHRDHDAPDPGGEGYGDLFPTNSPYVIISQGSSGSDQPFMRALPTTLAAFRPEVKAKLIQKGLLMPTLQMILRMTCKPVAERSDYLSGKAHPTVFNGAHVDPLKMAQLAHEITPETIPPLVQLRLLEADPASPGRDYFDPAQSESLAETECVIARIYRSMKSSRRLVVSAEGSFDVNGRPLEFHWVLLRGDPKLVTITPRNDAKSIAEITVRFHGRTPIAPGQRLESNRVDIGVFAQNGAHFSAPAFVTSFSLANEARTYDATGRLVEVGYGVSTSDCRIEDWPKFLDALRGDAPATRLVREKWTPAQLESAEKLRQALEPAAAHLAEMETQKTAAEAALKGAEADRKESLEAALKAAREARDKAAKERDALLDQQPAELPAPWKRYVPELLRALIEPPTFYIDRATDFAPLPPAAEGARKRLLALGIVRDSGTVFEVLPLLPGDTAPATRLSRYQSAELARFHGELLAAVLPGVKFEGRQPLVDSRLTTPKNWRDVYQHDGAGEMIGWTRYEEIGIRTDFTADGHAVLTRDHLDRPDTAVPVTYRDARDVANRKRRETPLTFTPHPPPLRYEYRNDADRRGRALPISRDESGAPGEQ